ncbi:MAG: response regulator [Planctomycetia bacterium]
MTAAPRRVLVVEDDTAIRRGVVAALTFAGYDVLEAGDGPRGLALAETAEVDLVLLDVVLPGADGLEILRRVRESRPTRPVILLTARAAEDDRVGGLAAGPTTTWSSHSASRNCWPGSRPCSVARRNGRGPWR